MTGSVRSQRDRELARYLAIGMSHARAADLAGVSERTVRRRLASPQFAELVDAERLRLTEDVLDTLVAGANTAAATLMRLATGRRMVLDADGQERNEDVPASVQVSACRALLAAAVTWRDQVELDQRMTALEAAVNARNLRVVR